MAKGAQEMEQLPDHTSAGLGKGAAPSLFDTQHGDTCTIYLDVRCHEGNMERHREDEKSPFVRVGG